MSGNYIALYVHLIWTTKRREPLLTPTTRYALFDHLRREALGKEINLRIVNGVADHVHGLVSLKSTQAVASVVKELKGESSRWLNQQGWFDGPFVWQDGYGAISVSPQHVPRVIRYMFNQEKHHARQSLEEEMNLFAQYTE